MSRHTYYTAHEHSQGVEVRLYVRRQDGGPMPTKFLDNTATLVRDTLIRVKEEQVLEAARGDT